MDFDFQEFCGWIGAGAGAIITGLHLWKRQSAARTEVAADTQLRDWYDRSKGALEEERARAEKAVGRLEKALDQHVEDAKTNARLSAEVDRLRIDRNNWRAMAESHARTIAKLASPDQRRVLKTDFAPFE